MKPPPFWLTGQRLRLAVKVGIDLPRLSNILHRRKRVSVPMAQKLENHSGIPWTEWATNETTSHPAFFGKPKAK